MKQGERFKDDFDAFDILDDRSGSVKDHLVGNWRRSILFTNPEFIARENEKKSDAEAVEEIKRAKKLKSNAKASTAKTPIKGCKENQFNKLQVPYNAQLQV